VRIETVGSGGWVSGVGEGTNKGELELGIGSGSFGMVPKVDGVSEESGVLAVVAGYWLLVVLVWL
jgi:hypothetical protein